MKRGQEVKFYEAKRPRRTTIQTDLESSGSIIRFSLSTPPPPPPPPPFAAEDANDFDLGPSTWCFHNFDPFTQESPCNKEPPQEARYRIEVSKKTHEMLEALKLKGSHKSFDDLLQGMISTESTPRSSRSSPSQIFMVQYPCLMNLTEYFFCPKDQGKFELRFSNNGHVPILDFRCKSYTP